MGLGKHNITSGEQYAKLLIEDIREMSKLDNKEGSMEETAVEYWCVEIKEACIKKYADYVAGDEEDYRLSEEEMRDLYQKAVETMTSELIESLVMKGDISMAVGSKGEILYSITEKGKKRFGNV